MTIWHKQLENDTWSWLPPDKKGRDRAEREHVRLVLPRSQQAEKEKKKKTKIGEVGFQMDDNASTDCVCVCRCIIISGSLLLFCSRIIASRIARVSKK